MAKRLRRVEPVKRGRYNDGLNGWKDEFSVRLQEDKDQISSNNPGWKTSDDAGGLFRQENYTLTRTYSQPLKITNGINLHYEGVLGASGGSAYSHDNSSLLPWGPIAYKRMKPTKPELNLVNMVWELRELPSMITQVQKGFQRNLKGIGDNFLSQVFGWMPLLGDLQSIIEAQQNIEKRIAWLFRNNGKWTSHEVTLRDTDTTQYSTGSGNGNFERSFTTQFYRSTPTVIESVNRRDRIWAKAQFKYFLPAPPPGVTMHHAITRGLAGFHTLRLDQIYRAVPWTWLVDWALGLANNLENIDNGVAERLAARRFFIMREQTVFVQRQVTGSFKTPGNGTVTAHAITAQEFSLKQRVRGYPFYPTNPNDLSPMQLGILGALGLSKYG